MIQIVSIGSEKVQYQVQFKAIKHMRMKIYPDATIIISAPKQTTQEQVERFVKEHRQWIADQLQNIFERNQRLGYEVLVNRYTQDGQIAYLGQYLKLLCNRKQGQKKYCFRPQQLELFGVEEDKCIQHIVEDFYKEYSQVVFSTLHEEVYKEYFEALGIQKATLQIKNMKASWGRCYPLQEKIILNRKLIQGPIACIQQVLVHEYVHLIHPNHSSAFYQMMEQLLPDYRQREEELTAKVQIRQ